jgi:membrane-bound metal-dependent hydrolase YbcI (DUF457 family)
MNVCIEYIYPPLYKYVTIFVLLFLFLKFYKQINNDKFLIISILFTLLVITLDYMMIYNHPPITKYDMEYFIDDDDYDDYDDL